MIHHWEHVGCQSNWQERTIPYQMDDTQCLPFTSFLIATIFIVFSCDRFSFAWSVETHYGWLHTYIQLQRNSLINTNVFNFWFQIKTHTSSQMNENFKTRRNVDRFQIYSQISAFWRTKIGPNMQFKLIHIQFQKKKKRIRKKTRDVLFFKSQNQLLIAWYILPYLLIFVVRVMH